MWLDIWIVSLALAIGLSVATVAMHHKIVRVTHEK
jgi:hypothetical protein